MTIRTMEFLNTLIDKKISDMHICLPAKILEYDHSKQQAKVKPLINKFVNKDNTIILPDIYNVPVMQLSSGQASITMPVNINDTVLLLFSEASLEEWLTNGQLATPDDPRRNNLTDAIALLGLRDFSKPAQADNNTDLLIKYDNSEIRFKPAGKLDIKCSDATLQVDNLVINGKVDITGNVKIDGDLEVTSNVKVSNKITSTTATIGNKDFATHAHLGVTTGGGTSGPVA